MGIRFNVLAVATIAAISLSACMGGPLRDRQWEPSETPCVEAGQSADGCEVSGYPGRDLSIFVPSSYNPRTPMPVVVFLHGGGGNAVNAQATTCPERDTASAECLWAVGEAEGFITVFATGYSARQLSPLRTWNAGGSGDYACASAAACEDNSDDIAYLGAVLDQVEAEYRVDTDKVFFMGFSNGAAMAHRVACELSDRVTGIVAASGANSFANGQPCDVERPVTVIHVHGTADACWSYETSLSACADFQDKPKIGVAESTAGWVSTLHCDATSVRQEIPDINTADGSTSYMETYSGCDGHAAVRIVTVEGGGHVFPGGAKVEATGKTDTVTRDFGSAELWQWLQELAPGR